MTDKCKMSIDKVQGSVICVCVCVCVCVWTEWLENCLWTTTGTLTVQIRKLAGIIFKDPVRTAQ